MKLCVTDTGTGIPDHEQNQLFKLFGKLKSNSEINQVGTGLGLALSKAFALNLGGNIFVESEFGEGSTFTVYLKNYKK